MGYVCLCRYRDIGMRGWNYNIGISPDHCWMLLACLFIGKQREAYIISLVYLLQDLPTSHHVQTCSMDSHL